jgi:hypothetical protein
VHKSKPAIAQGDGFRRRRRCRECTFLWWTIELTDLAALEREHPELLPRRPTGDT